ncbi:hypothetical protein [Sphingomonas xanthus]|uniref:Uncharacterized protein n=1 Tax=Sphingomonas xanthus TaxID=2594473 RepID=A0A516ISJ0_9SPHN|nr:hypothetical protein [Sphingomonas xanthus]QDP19829.1 hypothetical protein FMM02_07585 [Sphingomonas xanthus]
MAMYWNVSAAIVLIGFAMPAAAKDKVDPRIEAATACAAVQADADRLQCYDKAVGDLKLALSAGQLVPADEATTPSTLEGTVKLSFAHGFNLIRVELDSGDRFDLSADGKFDQPLKPGTKVKLSKGVLGNYWLTAPRSTRFRARFVGRSPTG